MKSLQNQISAMAREWPQFQSFPGLWPHSVIWLGELKGLERSFRIIIEYGLPMLGQGDLYRQMPVVRVLNPLLIPNYKAEEEAPIPHVYFEFPDIKLSPLCLFDPKAKEWDNSMLISKTTVGWASRWLAAYEFWEATGRWVGGGRHDKVESETSEDRVT